MLRVHVADVSPANIDTMLCALRNSDPLLRYALSRPLLSISRWDRKSVSLVLSHHQVFSLFFPLTFDFLACTHLFVTADLSNDVNASTLNIRIFKNEVRTPQCSYCLNPMENQRKLFYSRLLNSFPYLTLLHKFSMPKRLR